MADLLEINTFAANFNLGHCTKIANRLATTAYTASAEHTMRQPLSRAAYQEQAYGDDLGDGGATSSA